MAKTQRVCSVSFGSEMSGTTRINVDLVETRRGLRYRVATPPMPGIDEMGLTSWAGSRSEAREAFKALRGQLAELGFAA